jgi:hypothetical protein
MRTLKIDFTSAKVLPEGNDAGYIGEHNATQLIITPPIEMSECENIATYVVAFTTGGGVLYSDNILKTDEITVSLTSRLTTDYYLGVQLEGYDSEGELVVKSPLVTQLQLSPSARGTGTESDSGSINGNSPIISGHAHENKDALDLIGMNEKGLTFNGQKVGGAIIGSKFYENNWSDGSIVTDIHTTPSVKFLISERYPENRIITDISVRFEKDGEIRDYSVFEMILNGMISGDSVITIASKPTYDENSSMYAIANISSIGYTSESSFYSYASISDISLKGLIVHWLEV